MITEMIGGCCQGREEVGVLCETSSAKKNVKIPRKAKIWESADLLGIAVEFLKKSESWLNRLDYLKVYYMVDFSLVRKVLR